MTEEQFAEFTKIGEQVNELLKEACKSGDPAGELGWKVADLHRQWLGFTWPEYSKGGSCRVRAYVCSGRTFQGIL